MTQKIPHLYSMVLASLLDQAKGGRIPVWEYRQIVGRSMRVPKADTMLVLKEMVDFGILSYDEKTSTVTVV